MRTTYTRGLPILRMPGQSLEDARKDRQRDNVRRHRARKKQRIEENLKSEADNILDYRN